MKLNIKVEIDTMGILGRLDKGFGMAQKALDQTIVKDSNYFAPEDDETLKKSAIMSTKYGSGQIIWDTVYASRLYHNPQYNFSKDKNPNAQGLWYEAAKAQKMSAWQKVAQSTFNLHF